MVDEGEYTHTEQVKLTAFREPPVGREDFRRAVETTFPDMSEEHARDISRIVDRYRNREGIIYEHEVDNEARDVLHELSRNDLLERGEHPGGYGYTINREEIS